MTKQMYPPVFVVANLESKPLPTSLLNALKVEAHNLTKTGELDVSDAMKFEPDPGTRSLQLLHHHLNVTPCAAKFILATDEISE